LEAKAINPPPPGTAVGDTDVDVAEGRGVSIGVGGTIIVAVGGAGVAEGSGGVPVGPKVAVVMVAGADAGVGETAPQAVTKNDASRTSASTVRSADMFPPPYLLTNYNSLPRLCVHIETCF
jgi:hypothetical protein